MCLVLSELSDEVVDNVEVLRFGFESFQEGDVRTSMSVVRGLGLLDGRRPVVGPSEAERIDRQQRRVERDRPMREVSGLFDDG